ncbi:hypothetical protein [Paenibacillus silviterrae]|uniref:hypothetical protein n=1 Tax=Paenibacillus silviterrae TaxID=3242194 RepID=UPI002543ED5D|nr:hypothetical protein [Paenibacillus chinjuensis]
MNMGKYVGKTIDIIYIGLDERITQRRIHVKSSVGGIVKAHCLHRNDPRTFRIENILAVKPVNQYAS